MAVECALDAAACKDWKSIEFRDPLMSNVDEFLRLIERWQNTTTWRWRSPRSRRRCGSSHSFDNGRCRPPRRCVARFTILAPLQKRRQGSQADNVEAAIKALRRR